MRFSLFRKKKSQADLKSPESYWSDGSDTDSDYDDSWETDSAGSIDYAERYFQDLGDRIQMLIKNGISKGVLENAREKITSIRIPTWISIEEIQSVDDLNFYSANSLLEEEKSMPYVREDCYVPINRLLRSMQKSLEDQRRKAIDINTVLHSACSCTNAKDYFDDWTEEMNITTYSHMALNHSNSKTVALANINAELVDQSSRQTFHVNWSECPSSLENEPIFLQNDSQEERKVKELENYLQLLQKSDLGARDFAFAHIVPAIYPSSSSDSNHGLLSGTAKKRKSKFLINKIP